MSEQRAGILEEESKQYPDPGWIEVQQPADMPGARVVKVTKTAFEAIYRDRGYTVVEPKKKES